MDAAVNGHLVNGTTHAPIHNGNGNGKTEAHELALEELERELPLVHDGQVPLGELVSRLVQTMYAELVEMAET